jgi:hypothetical protein
MHLLIKPYLEKHRIELAMINIDQDETLKAHYNTLIPVLSDEHENIICQYFFDKVSFEQFIENYS